MDEQTTQTGEDGIWLPLAEAADRLNVSVKTARRRVKAGDLVSRQVPTQHGQAYEVWLPTTPAAHTHSTTVNGQATHGVDSGAAMLELVHLVAQLQGEVVDKAEAAAMWQTRAELLAIQLQQAQERILALEAPKEPASTARPLGSDSGAFDLRAALMKPSETKRRPWWRVW